MKTNFIKNSFTEYLDELPLVELSIPYPTLQYLVNSSCKNKLFSYAIYLLTVLNIPYRINFPSKYRVSRQFIYVSISYPETPYRAS